MQYYRLILYVIFGVLPSLIWLSYYLKKDLHPEPKKMIVKVFFYGGLITIPTFFIQIWLSKLLNQLHFTSYPIIVEVFRWFLVIALTEEFLKYAAVKLSMHHSYEPDEPLDIMLYMVVAALGFAAVENVLYLFSPIDNVPFNTLLQTTIAISFIRFMGATFLHTLCSGLLGYFLALASLKKKNGLVLTMSGISLAALSHGLYNFSITTLQGPISIIIPTAVIMGLTIFMLYDFNEVKKIKSICKI